LFTRDFKRFLTVLTSTTMVIAVYVAVHLGLGTFSGWVERHSAVYPYQNEDWLRYFLPDLLDSRGRGRLLLAGESAVRENLLFEEFDRSIPSMKTFQGALSLGTIDDVLLSLDYIENAYGAEALPQVLVLGLSPRFVANIPEHRPFLDAVDNYTKFRVVRDASGPRLQRKTLADGWFSSLRFRFLKSPERYWGATVAATRDLLQVEAERPDQLPRARQLAAMALTHPVSTARQISRRYVWEETQRWASPYKYHQLAPLSRESLRGWLNAPESWWHLVHTWNPDEHRATVQSRIRRLRAFVERHNIALYVFNQPESSESRRLYNPAFYASYFSLMEEEFEGVPFLDLRELLSDEEFYDAVHATLPGARRTTDQVINFIKSQPGGEISGPKSAFRRNEEDPRLRYNPRAKQAPAHGPL
jgi:hypothetical protein